MSVHYKCVADASPDTNRGPSPTGDPAKRVRRAGAFFLAAFVFLMLLGCTESEAPNLNVEEWLKLNVDVDCEICAPDGQIGIQVEVTNIGPGPIALDELRWGQNVDYTVWTPDGRRLPTMHINVYVPWGPLRVLQPGETAESEDFSFYTHQLVDEAGRFMIEVDVVGSQSNDEAKSLHIPVFTLRSGLLTGSDTFEVLSEPTIPAHLLPP